MFYIKKALTGSFKRVPEEEAEFVVQTVQEYKQDKIITKEAIEAERIAAAEMEKYRANEHDYIHEVLAAYNEGETAGTSMMEDMQQRYEKISTELEDSREAISKLNKENTLLKEEAERNASLNRHFLRVSRERSNAANGLPKKEGSGYIVLSTSQYRDRVVTEFENGIETPVDCWKTVLRTCYDASIPLAEIRQEIRCDLIDTVLGLLGVEFIQTNDRNGQYQTWTVEASDGSQRIACGIYRWIYRANFRDGYWELELYHNLPVTVPTELRPQRNDVHGKKAVG